VSEQPALAVYGDALTGCHRLVLRRSDGSEREHDVRRWVCDADRTDLALLDRCTGPVVDLGCGPGRLVSALARRGQPALGVDLSPRAVAMARARGAAAVVRDLFEPLPGEGRWDGALLVDGNVGIGGAPDRLLRRVRDLLRPGGGLLVEVSAQDVVRTGPVQLVGSDGRVSRPFRWAEVGISELRRLAASEGWAVTAEWAAAGRRFAHLRAATP
jgi:SAM-dependent methyltransferase